MLSQEACAPENYEAFLIFSAHGYWTGFPLCRFYQMPTGFSIIAVVLSCGFAS
jgi:hypothetical protein